MNDENLWDALTGQTETYLMGSAAELLHQWDESDMFRAAGTQRSLMSARDVLIRTSATVDPDQKVELPLFALLALTRLALKKLQ